MPKAKSSERIKALELFLESNGKNSIRFIAEETGATQATVRSWRKRDEWDKALRAQKRGVIDTPGTESVAKRGDTATKKRSGGQPGNRNAVGNKGGKGNPAPKGNDYALTTGEYETILFSTFTETERLLAEKAPANHKDMLMAEYRLAIVREHRILQRIEAAQRSAERGMVPASVSVESYSHGEDKKSTTKRSNTSHESLDERMTRLEDALTRVQEHIRKLAAQLHKFDYDDRRLAFEREKILLIPPKELEERPEAETAGLTIIYDYGDGGDANV